MVIRLTFVLGVYLTCRSIILTGTKWREIGCHRWPSISKSPHKPHFPWKSLHFWKEKFTAPSLTFVWCPHYCHTNLKSFHVSMSVPVESGLGHTTPHNPSMFASKDNSFWRERSLVLHEIYCFGRVLYPLPNPRHQLPHFEGKGLPALYRAGCFVRVLYPLPDLYTHICQPQPSNCPSLFDACPFTLIAFIIFSSSWIRATA